MPRPTAGQHSKQKVGVSASSTAVATALVKNFDKQAERILQAMSSSTPLLSFRRRLERIARADEVVRKESK